MKSRSILVLGGARSGKSRYAESLALHSGQEKVYLATAEARDEEMRTRVSDHKQRRGEDWTTVEAPMDLTKALHAHARSERAVVVDCLTLWLSNLMLGGGDTESAGEDLARLVPDLPGTVILVSNEVGSGIVPDNELGRRFRDAQGRLNQIMASACDSVVLVVAGLPMILKGEQPK
jgi:adenosylcobinamide kinase/adenosylcobinamide-phosphate guanylyltransferase